MNAGPTVVVADDPDEHRYERALGTDGGPGEIDRDGVVQHADAFEAERFAGGGGQVPGAAFDVGPAVDHLGDQDMAVVDELDRRAAGQVLVGDAERARPQSLPAGGLVAPEAGAVPAGAGDAEGAEGEFAAFGELPP